MNKKSPNSSPILDREYVEVQHVYDELFGLLSDEYTFTPAEREQVNSHLEQCVECQVLVGKYLVDTIAFLREHGESEEQARTALEKLRKLTHTTLKQDIPAYAEIAEEASEEKAQARYPWLASHMEGCEECRLAIQNIREWLREEHEIDTSEASEGS